MRRFKVKRSVFTLKNEFLYYPIVSHPTVTGALCRKTDPKIVTAPKTQSRSKDQNDKDKFKVESKGKNLISLSLKASLNKFSSRIVGYQNRVPLALVLSRIM